MPAADWEPTRKAWFRCFSWLLYACATLQFARYYVVSTTFYLDMGRYLNGHERLPFQERILPVFLMWPINHSAFLMRHLTHAKGPYDAPSASTPETLAFYILSLISFAIAAVLVQLLYDRLTRNGALRALVFPTFLALTMWTYVVHVDADFSYPYDMPALAFFAAGLLCIYTRQFVPLLLVMLFGTANRETTLFLVGIYALDAASCEKISFEAPLLQFGQRLRLQQVPWGRVLALLGVWLAVKLGVHHHFAGNDASENYVRIRENVGRLRPRLWPTLLNICGYVLPVVAIFGRRLRPMRFGNYLYILPVWFAVMFYTGVILESRIYGELCSFTAVAAVLLLEEQIGRAEAGREASRVTQRAEA